MLFQTLRFSAVLNLIHIFLCLFFSFLIGGHGTEVERDISCLKSIKDSLEDPYGSLYTWNFEKNSKYNICHTFRGVTCSNNYDRVLYIQLASLGLKGQFPLGIENCSSLQLVDLSSNELSGNIPSHIFSLVPSLVKLDLSGNKFSGEIPTSIANLTELYILRLNNNSLSGYIPSHIFSMLPSLDTLDLSYNKFSGEISVSIGNCTHLNFLRLNNNELSGYIPSHMLRMLTSLVELDLSYNKFSGEIPESICNLTHLKILRLNNNEFFGEIPQQLGKLTHLLEFRVANNLLSGPVPLFANNVCIGNRESYLDNTGLCGGPFEPCNQFRQSFREGLLAGYVFSATSVIVVYVSYFVPWTQMKKAGRKKPEQVGVYNAFITRKMKKVEQKEENQMDKQQFDLSEKQYQSLLHLDLQEKQCQALFPPYTS